MEKKRKHEISNERLRAMSPLELFHHLTSVSAELAMTNREIQLRFLSLYRSVEKRKDKDSIEQEAAEILMEMEIAVNARLKEKFENNDKD